MLYTVNLPCNEMEVNNQWRIKLTKAQSDLPETDNFSTEPGFYTNNRPNNMKNKVNG